MDLSTALVLCVVIAGALMLLWADRRGSDERPTGPSMDDHGALKLRVTELERLVDDLPQKWEEMVKQAKRSEDRARAVVRRAQAELEEAGYEHPGVEAEAGELRLFDGTRGDEGGVQPVRQDVGAPAEPPTDEDEGWERATMKRKYGG